MKKEEDLRLFNSIVCCFILFLFAIMSLYFGFKLFVLVVF